MNTTLAQDPENRGSPLLVPSPDSEPRGSKPRRWRLKPQRYKTVTKLCCTR
jgi:hypothetical protein